MTDQEHIASAYDRDLEAVETYQKLYPNREIVQVPINHVAIGGGGVLI